MISFLSVLTSVKDYIEITHKLLEADPSLFQIKNYDEFGAVLTYFVLSVKDFLIQFFSLTWLKNFWSLPIIVPDIASAMVSEISVIDGSFHNAFSFLESPLLYGQQSALPVYGLEKFFIGFINSIFLVLPTSAAHIITLRRFVMQGVEIGYLAGLGTIAGNLFWLAAIIFGWRFFVIPWLSFDSFRYLFGFVLLVKYLWDCTKERRMVLEDVNKSKIFLLNFLLALTEQTCIYPFLSNISISPEASLLETFPAESIQQFIFIHFAYLLGIFVGSYSLLLLSCWFWEYPAFTIYLWIQTKSNYRFTTRFYYKLLNNIFTYLTMLATISSIPYYGLDYSITKQLGLVPQDRLITQKPSLQNRSEYERLMTETSFLDIQPTNMNLRVRDGQRPRRERWKQHFIKYEALDVSVYDQGVYDFLTIEDLNYGFDRFWFRRKMRNHTTHFRLFPGPWMRTVKKQLLGPGKESRRNDFFTLLFEQYYHPNFHKINENVSSFAVPEAKAKPSPLGVASKGIKSSSEAASPGIDQAAFATKEALLNNAVSARLKTNKLENTRLATQDFKIPILNQKGQFALGFKTRAEFSALRKFVRKFNSRIKTSEINLGFSSKAATPGLQDFLKQTESTKPIYSKRWKHLYSNIWRGSNNYPINSFRTLSRKIFLNSTNIKKQVQLLEKKQKQSSSLAAKIPSDASLEAKGAASFSSEVRNMLISSAQPNSFEDNKQKEVSQKLLMSENFKRTLAREKLSKKDRQILRFRTQLLLSTDSAIRKDGARSFFGLPSVTAIAGASPLNGVSNGTAKNAQTMQFQSRALLHPLKFYLQKEEAFRRKLKFYGSAVFRKLSIGNNAPYFRTIMKRGFYYYKKNLRWKRTENVAALRRGLRKSSRTPRKLVTSDFAAKTDSESRVLFADGQNSPVLSSTLSKNLSENNSFVDNASKEAENPILLGVNRITKSNHFYSNVGKRSSRYRFQIYKDVLQHWYYTPFNRLLLRFDIDAFINRQPKNHFLTKKEEQLLHLRRILLSEHYDTLRWYTFMQHYRSMKTRLGGTKSFASRIYNQQFQGTFKKIRHLFAITPSQTKYETSGEALPYFLDKVQTNETPTILKFDQALYNEYSNSTNLSASLPLPLPKAKATGQLSNEKEASSAAATGNAATLKMNESLEGKTKNQGAETLLMNSVFHEELFVPLNISSQEANSRTFSSLAASLPLPEVKAQLIDKETKTNQNMLSAEASQYPVSTSLGVASQGNEAAKIEDLITTSNKIVANYLLKTEPLQKQYIKELIQENNYPELLKFLYMDNKFLIPFIENPDNFEKNKKLDNLNFSEFKNGEVVGFKKSGSDHPEIKSLIQQEVWVQFLKQSKKRLNNQKFMKKYINYRVTKRENRISKKQKQLNKRLQKLKTWLISTALLDYIPTRSQVANNITRGLEKTFKKGTSVLPKIDQSPSAPLPSLREQPVRLPSAQAMAKAQLSNLEMQPGGEEKIKVSLQSIRKVLEKTAPKSNPNFRIIGASLMKTKTTLNSITKSFIQKSKPLYFFLKQRPDRAKYNLWKKRQKVKAKVRRQRKTIVEKSIPEAFQNRMNKNIKTVVYYDKWALQEIVFPFSSKQNSDSPYESSLKSSLTQQGSLKLFPRFKESDSPSVFKKFIKKKLTSSQSIIFKEYKIKKKTRSQYTPNYLFAYNANKLKKIKWINKQTFKEQIRSMSKKEKHKILKNGGFLSNFISKMGISFMKEDNLNSSSKAANENKAENFNFIWSKTETTKKNKFREKKKRRRKFSIKTKYQKSINKHSKFNKRNIYRKGKLKKLGKQLKHIKSNIQLQVWWWQTYLPKFQADFISKNRSLAASLPLETNPAALLTEGNSVAKQAIAIAGGTGITSMKGKDVLIEKENYKPLKTLFSSEAAIMSLPLTGTSSEPVKSEEEATKVLKTSSTAATAINNLYENLLSSKADTIIDATKTKFEYPEVIPTNPLPFYAGWDESLRKFIVTNRFLSRRDAGFNLQNLNQFETLQPLAKVSKENELEFTMSPIFGLNEVSFLYWENEMPFKIFDIEQYNTNVVSFYAPIGWRRFEFRHSILKTWLNTIGANSSEAAKGSKLVPSKYEQLINALTAVDNLNKATLKINGNKTLKLLSNGDLLVTPLSCISSEAARSASTNIIQQIQYKQKRISQKFRNRRIKKRYKRVKSAPLTFVFKPQGPLLNDLLPSHYLSVFNSQYRLPRHRYLKYKLLKNSKFIDPLTSTNEYNTFLKQGASKLQVPSFTLRKRSKPKRKFHRKRLIKQGGLIFPRRRKFINSILNNGRILERNAINDQNILSSKAANSLNSLNNLETIRNQQLRWRPLSESEFNLTQPKTRVKTDTNRRRKLRRKMFKQVYKPIQRFQPRFGGFTWPGDYPRLEWTDMPRLESLKEDAGNTLQRKRLNKEKRRLGMVGDLPHKYLLKKHNLNVLKKKLEKAQHSNKIRERAQELKVFLNQ